MSGSELVLLDAPAYCCPPAAWSRETPGAAVARLAGGPWRAAESSCWRGRRVSEPVRRCCRLLSTWAPPHPPHPHWNRPNQVRRRPLPCSSAGRPPARTALRMRLSFRSESCWHDSVYASSSDPTAVVPHHLPSALAPLLNIARPPRRALQQQDRADHQIITGMVRDRRLTVTGPDPTSGFRQRPDRFDTQHEVRRPWVNMTTH